MDGWNPIVSFFVWLPGRRFRLLVSGTVASSAESPLGIRAGPKHAGTNNTNQFLLSNGTEICLYTNR